MNTIVTPGNTRHVATLFGQSQNVSRSTMSSREVAELTGKSHDNVLRDARGLLASGVLKSEETTYRHPQNGQLYPEFILDQRDCLVLVSGYNAKIRAKIIDRWQELESRVVGQLQIPASFAEALRLAADQAEQNLQLQQVIAKQAPKVEALHRLAKTHGDVCITTAAQILGIRPTNLFAWLNQNRWIHRRTAHSSWVAYQPRLNNGWLKHKLVKVGGGEGQDIKVVEQVMVTRSGIVTLAEQIQGITL
ncbi:phage regulatory protein/antirepressor Ant [Pseudomonas sp. MAG733B]|uniref:Rha family transcriptional regulator n=1 Tax=Pseudomonas sp. MAG733B TaxID=3122079 RepID=UPI0030CE2F91